LVLGFSGALVVPGGVSAVTARARCRATAFVTNGFIGTVSTIDVKTRTKNANDIPVGSGPLGVAVTPDGKAAFVANGPSGTVSTIDVKTRTKDPTDIAVGPTSVGVKVTPDGKTAFVTRGGSSPGSVYFGSDSVSTIDVKTRTKNPTDIAVGALPFGVAVTPDGKTAFVANGFSDSVSTIDVKTRTKNPTDIPVGAGPLGVAVTPCRR
jgi:YVTN family beta-propeller protein